MHKKSIKYENLVPPNSICEREIDKFLSHTDHPFLSTILFPICSGIFRPLMSNSLGRSFSISMKRAMEQSHHSKVEDIFEDYKGRRSGILKAITTEYEEFQKQCDADESGMCLFGLPDGQWELKLASDVGVSPEIPKPTTINFCRNVETNQWLQLIAVHSDVWLLGVASFLAINLDFSKAEREQLFYRINALPTVEEELLEAIAKRQQEGNSSARTDSRNQSKPSSKLGTPQSLGEKLTPPPKKEDDKNAVCGASGAHNTQDDGKNAVCNACGLFYILEHDAAYNTVEGNIFWIYCDICMSWFHGQCVYITPVVAKGIKEYKCPLCRSRKKCPS